MDLLPLSVLANLPAKNAADQLAYLASAARSNLTVALADDEIQNNGMQKDTLRAIYTDALASFAERLAGQTIMRPTTNSQSAFIAFEGRLNNAISALRVADLTGTTPDAHDTTKISVSRLTKRALQLEIATLIELIEDSDIIDSRKKALLRKARELQDEVNRDGTNLTKILTTAAAIAGLLGGGSTFALNAPKIVASIQRLHVTIGDEVLDQEETRLALPAPQRLLTGPDA